MAFRESEFLVEVSCGIIHTVQSPPIGLLGLLESYCLEASMTAIRGHCSRQGFQQILQEAVNDVPEDGDLGRPGMGRYA